MPVSTRRNQSTSTTTDVGSTPIAITADKARTKELTLQDVINSINCIEKTLNAMIENQVAVLHNDQATLSKEIKDKLTTIEKSLNDNSDSVIALQEKCDTQQKQ